LSVEIASVVGIDSELWGSAAGDQDTHGMALVQDVSSRPHVDRDGVGGSWYHQGGVLSAVAPFHLDSSITNSDTGSTVRINISQSDIEISVNSSRCNADGSSQFSAEGHRSGGDSRSPFQDIRTSLNFGSLISRSARGGGEQGVGTDSRSRVRRVVSVDP